MLGRESAEIFAMLKADREKAGAPLDDFNLILAACALSHDLVLVTNNVRLIFDTEKINIL
jgi:predicted nucleic acid-binding protein